MAHLIDSYSESNQNYQFRTEDYPVGIGQTFLADGSIIDSVKFYLRKYGSPNGNVYAKVYDRTTEELVATSNGVDTSTISGSFELVVFIFSGANRILLDNFDDGYFVVIEHPDAIEDNCLEVGVDNSSPTHSGLIVKYFGGDWHTDSDEDACFYLYGVRMESITADGIVYIKPNVGSKEITADGLVGYSRYYLNNSFIPSPIHFSRDFIQTRQYLRAINGKESVDMGNRKEKYILKYDRLTQNESTTIINIVNKNEPVIFRIANGSFILNNTYVLPEITRIEYARGGDYMSKIELTLTEVK